MSAVGYAGAANWDLHTGKTAKYAAVYSYSEASQGSLSSERKS